MAARPPAIPRGYTSVTPHMVIRDAARAVEFYKKAFGALELSRFPAPLDGKKLMHAELKIGNAIIMLGDEMGGSSGGNSGGGGGPGKCRSPQSLGGTSVSLYLYVDDVDASFQRAVDAGAKVIMPVMDMFWGDRYGMVADPFGHEWSLATHQRDLTMDEMRKGAQEMMAQMARKECATSK